MTTQATTQATTQVPTKEQLQIMYNNFVKISQWLTKKEDAPSPLPPLYADILSELKALRDKVADLEFKQAANLEEIHYLQSLITRNERSEILNQSTPQPVAEETIPPAEPEPKQKKSRKKKAEVEQSQTEEEPPSDGEALSAPIHTPAPAPSQELPQSVSELETEPLDIELDSTVFTSVSEEVSKILDEINKRSEDD